MTLRRAQKAALFFWVVPFVAALGCNDTREFSTQPGEAYCGPIVEGTFVREGLDPTLRARMTFNADQLASTPGLLWTSDGLFAGTTLRAIPKLTNDPLSMLTFGEGRDRNIIDIVDPTDPARGPGMMSIVSLMHDGSVELRLLRGAPMLDMSPPPVGDGVPVFGLFRMQRDSIQATTCAF